MSLRQSGIPASIQVTISSISSWERYGPRDGMRRNPPTFLVSILIKLVSRASPVPTFSGSMSCKSNGALVASCSLVSHLRFSL